MTTSINISSCWSEKPQRVLRNAFQRRNVEGFKFALENLQADPNVIDRADGLSIFEDILQTPNTAQFIILCIDNGADMYKRNSHNRYPLHYAVDSMSPSNLRAFLSTYDANRINVKYSHKNSLHLIMEDLAKHDYENASEIIKILIEHGCDINMPNEKSRTPFNLLLRAQPKLKDKNELVDFVMQNCEVDLYTYRSKEMIDLFVKNNQHHPLPEKRPETINAELMLKFLTQKNQHKFIANFKVFKDNEINKQKSDENSENNSNDFKEISAKFLYEAIQNNCEDVIDYLVDEGVDVNKKPNDSFQAYSPAMFACARGNHRMLEAFFRANPPPLVYDGKKSMLHLATEHLGMDPSKNVNYNFEKCFYLALKHCDDLNQQDSNGCTPLHYAAKYRNDKAVLELLRRGSFIGAKSFTNESPIENMSYDALETYLNECISTKPRRYGDEKQQIVIDYNFLVAPKSTSAGEEFAPEIEALKEITCHQELRPLISHPVLSSFLYLKWTKLPVTLCFHLNLLFFAMFMMSLISFIVLCQTLTPAEQAESASFALFKTLSIVSVFVLAIRELIQFFLSPRNYLKSLINYFEIVLILLGYMIIFHQSDDSSDVTMRILRALTILAAAYEFLNLIGTLPYMNISTHMVILRKVAKTFLKSLLLYSILILAFALSFFTLFGGKEEGKKEAENGNKADDGEKDDGAYNNFGYPGIAIIKTMVMLTGEFDASDLLLDKKDGFYSIFFLLFVFLMTIVLFNLLNALAIDDTQQIRVEGELVDLCERIKVLSNYERVFLSSNGKRIFKKFISLFPYTIPRAKIFIHPDNNNEILTYKMPPNNMDIEVNKHDDQELQSLNSSFSFNRLIPNQKISDQLQRYSRGMDNKIMKKIRVIFEERNQKDNDQIQTLMKKICSMDSEIRTLKTSIYDLSDKLTQQFNAK